MEYFNQEELNAFNIAKGEDASKVSEADQHLIKSMHEKAIHLAHLLQTELKGHSIKSPPSIINPVKTGSQIKRYFWYRIFPDKEWREQAIALTFTLEDAFVLRVDSVGWGDNWYKRKKLLEYRESQALEEHFPYEEFLQWNDYQAVVLKIAKFYRKKLVPKQSQFLNIARIQLGLLASDGTGWQDRHIEHYKDIKHTIVWNSKKPVGVGNTLEQIRDTIQRKGYFDLFYLKKDLAYYKAEIVDVATSDKELTTWPSKHSNIPDFEPRLEYFYDENKQARLVMLCRALIKLEQPLSKFDFTLYEGVKYPVHDNLAPFIVTEQLPGARVLEKPKSLNQILYGPPGTGKTYHTINEAIKIANPDFDLNKDRAAIKQEYDRLVATGQIAFTTFHQSMTYEDFVEGIKPILEGDVGSAVSYNIEDGIFKKMSELARIPTIDNFDRAYHEFLDSFEDSSDEIIQLTSLKGSSFGVSINSNGNLNLHTGASKNHQGVLTKTRIKNQFTGIQKNKWHAGYFEGVINHLKGNYHLKESSGAITKNYVIIIDEINRGNVSAIFGELITLIEESKRLGSDEELTVTLPYSKTIFGVPANLYLIGTMNTADRSIEALDTALRRRFHFIEMPPEADLIKSEGKLKDTKGVLEINIYNTDTKEELTEQDEKEKYLVDMALLLNTINKRILLLLDRDHLIGHSFFLSVANADDLKQAFARQIIPLLQEYFYGDYGKIALVLGEGFCEPVKKEKTLFARINGYDPEELYNEQTLFSLNNPMEMDDEELIEALQKLLNDA